MAQQPGGALAALLSQFARPHGPLGRVAGRLMSTSAAPSRWIVDDVLRVGQNDDVIDVGCGPGLVVRAAADRATWGLVAGVDPSEVMVAQARARNRDAVRAGRVTLTQAPAESLPHADAAFDLAVAANSLPFWDSPEKGVAEIRRVLRPGGLLAVVLRTARAGAGRLDPSRYGATGEDLDGVRSLLGDGGFTEATTTSGDLGRETLVAVCGRRD